MRWLIILSLLICFQSNVSEGQTSESKENKTKVTISLTNQKKVVDGIITELLVIKFKFKAKVSPEIENGLLFLALVLLRTPNVIYADGELKKEKKEFVLKIQTIFPDNDPDVYLRVIFQEITNEFKEIFGENIIIEDVKLEKEKKEV